MTTMRAMLFGTMMFGMAGVGYAAPVNDSCSTPKIIGALPYADSLATGAATTEPGEHDQCGCSVNQHSVWWRFSAPTSGVVRADTYGSTYDTVLDVSAAPCPSGQPLTCNDDAAGRQSEVSFSACAGRTYYLKVSSYCGDAATNAVLNVRLDSPVEPDGDGDGIGDCSDDCPNAYDPAQADGDGDHVGDACDSCPALSDPTNDPLRCTDSDGDSAMDAFDNCRFVANADQADGDGDTVGDACDGCPSVADPEQNDADSDGIGDACDACTDPDHDGFGSPGFAASTCPLDNCPDAENPDQADRDHDGVGDVCLVCGYVGPITRYGIAARASWKEVTTRHGGYPSGSWAHTCVYKGVVGAFETEGSIIATKPSGKALGFRPIRNDEINLSSSRVRGDLLTGGGYVNGPVEVDGSTDTTGANPEVDRCAAVLGQMVGASAAFAAMPPTRTLGDLNLHRGTDDRESDYVELYLDPGEVVNIDSLVMEGYSFRHDPYGIFRECDGPSNDAPEIYIEGGPAVINFGELQLGNCANVYLDGEFIFNVPGPGRKVTVGLGAYGGPILAPLRNIETTGSDSDHFTEAAFLWGKRVKSTGGTWVYGSDGNGAPYCAAAE